MSHTTDLGELLASLPDSVLIPSERLNVEQSAQLVAMFAAAVDAPTPTPEQLETERAARRPAPPSQAARQLAKRFPNNR